MLSCVCVDDLTVESVVDSGEGVRGFTLRRKGSAINVCHVSTTHIGCINIE